MYSNSTAIITNYMKRGSDTISPPDCARSKMIFIVAHAHLLLLLLYFVDLSESTFSAFCKLNTTDLRASSNLFPLDTPSSSMKLWPWDAVHHIEKGTIEITVVQRRACKFNHTKWHRVVDKFPHFSKYLAHGREENVLVGSNETNLAKLEIVICRFYVNGNNTPVAETKSEKVSGMWEFMQQGTTQIVCPSPPMSYDTIRLVRLPRTGYFSATKSRPQSSLSAFNRETLSDAFPVCQPATLRNGLTEIELEERKKGRLSVCTATGRSDRGRLVEWIEYHRLMGVDHFYLYDTSIKQKAGGLRTLLADYASEGVVTVVPWAYENCVRGMAGGRFLTYAPENSTHKIDIFHPPKAIAQSAALASCYSRYKDHTEYMMHIDDDEFIAMGSSVLKKGFGHNKSHLTNNGEIYRPLFEFVDKIFNSSKPDMPAVAFTPLRKHNCSTIEGKIARVPSGLPRIGEWLYGRKRLPIEVKLVMRTSVVRNFLVHYISQVEMGLVNYGPLQLNPIDVAVLHYKEPEEMAGDIYGPTKLDELVLGNPENHFCREMKRYGGLREDIEGGYFPAIGKAPTPLLHNINYTNIIQRIDPAIQAMLLKNFKERMKP